MKKLLGAVSYETLITYWKRFTWNEILIFGLVFSIFFPVRYVIESPSAYLTGAYSDFTSFAISLSDCLIIALFILNIKSFTRNNLLIYLTWITLLIFTTWLSPNQFLELNLYLGFKLSLLIGLTLLIRELSLNYFHRLAQIFILLGVVQSLIGLAQFLVQQSIGLKILGESVLSPSLLGVAKVVSYETPFIRSYGTLPHPNILGAILVVCLLFNIYLITKSSHKYAILYKISLAITTWGLILTFSRSAWLAFTTCAILYISRGIITNSTRSKFYHVTFVLFISIGSLVLILWPFIASRATYTDNAVMERRAYNRIGTDMIKNTIPTGYGIGESALRMDEYSATKLEPWEKQPIHNFFLISIAELGLVGLFLIMLIYKPIFQMFHVQKGSKLDGEQWLLLFVFLAISIMMLFDHFFYTIQPTQIMLWLFVLLGYNVFHDKKSLIYGTFYQK